MNRHCINILCASLLCLGATTLPVAGQNIVTNGSFEQTVLPSNLMNTTYWAGSTSVTGWTIASGSVDLTSERYLECADGVQTLDLSGYEEGLIYQNLATTPGAQYKLRFAMAGNTELAPIIKTMRVYWAGSLLSTLTYDGTNHNRYNLGYTYYEYQLTAQSTSTRLTFESLTHGLCGPALDDVSVTQVPEPSSILALSLAACGLGTAALKRRRR